MRKTASLKKVMNDSFTCNSDHSFAQFRNNFFFYQSCIAIAFTFLRNTPCQKVVTDGRNMSKDRQVFTEEILAIFDIFKPPG